MIRPIEEKDFAGLVKLYKEFFPVHSVFSLDGDVIESYLRKEMLEREAFFVDDELRGAVVLVLLQSGSHSRWKYRHFAFQNNEIGEELLQKCEKFVKEFSPTSKIELTIAESEQGKEFYESNGYIEEGKLAHHYRLGEICFILGKSFV